MKNTASISLILSALIFARSVYNLVNFRKSIVWLRTKVIASKKPNTRFIVCIPVLNEQKTIIPTLNIFLNQRYPNNQLVIYVATTSKEQSYDRKLTTKQIVERYRKLLPIHQRSQIQIINYPSKDGRMAHQINYVADALRKDLKEKNTYFVIYNADSNILDNTFFIVDAMASKLKSKIGKSPNIFQQSAVYQYKSSNNTQRYIAEGAGLHQTLWTLMHEIPSLLLQSSKVTRLNEDSSLIKIIKDSRLVHCVGHGLFIKGDYYLKHPLPQDILNEDLPYGLMVCALREPVYSIPSLELASTPSKLRNVYRQKSVWFNPFFEFYSYARLLRKNRIYQSKAELNYLLIKAYARLSIWLLHSSVILGGLVVSLFAGLLYTVIWFIAFGLYWLIPALYMTRVRQEIQNGGSNTYLSVIAGSFYALTHSIGPIWALGRWIRAKIRGVRPSKPKTDVA